MATTHSFSEKALISLIRVYQTVISPLIGPRCRFTPSCSHYAIDALKMHGTLKGSWLTIKRVLKCHPLSKGGYDPVPEKLDITHHNNYRDREKK